MNARHATMFAALVLAAATLTACGANGYGNPMSPSSYQPPSASPSPVGASLTIRIVAMDGSQSFSPNPSLIAAGDSLAFYNADSSVHRIVADSGAFDTGNLAPGATSAVFTMVDAGAFAYHCAIHPTEVGTLNVASQ
jgi:plastocyanin